MLTFEARPTPGLDLPAEIGLSVNDVLRLGGVSSGKSGGITGCCDRILGPGELGRDVDVWLRPLDITRPVETEMLGAAEEFDDGLRRVGVDGREFDRVTGKLELAEFCDLELGVEGLEFCDCRGLSPGETVGIERALEGVEDLEGVVRLDGVEGLEVDDDRVMGEDGLM